MIVTLGGRAGAGKSTVGQALADMLGYKFYSAGDVRREYAKKHGLTIAELNKRGESDPASDKLVDDYLNTIGMALDDFVIDSRLGPFFIPNSYKAFLIADDMVRAKRTYEKARLEEKPASIEDALEMLNKREASDIIRYRNLYGIHPFDLKRFDIVVDTTNRTVEKTAILIYNYIMSPVMNKR
ncbi:cytidylate kinase family protein [Candidatus Woesearchaeota archaeon]|nr:cytidylate kinase family protein [Candidatus Woesearchaeota archaeon]